MDSFRKYFKKLIEDRVILAKEDGEGGAPVGGDASGGEISAPAGGEGASDNAADVLPPGMKPTHTGLSTTDVLGKCDHKKDGVFGPGCFHLPCVWSVPYYRLPRKKKKRKKFPQMTIVQEDEEFKLFKDRADGFVEDEVGKAQEWLNKIDPEIKLSVADGYEFEGDKADWVAALDRESQDDMKEFSVAFNLPVIFGFLDENGLDDDDTELRLQIRVSLWHELGHALVDYFRDEDIYDFEVSGVKEEELCEEFARHAIREYSGVTKSKLMDFIFTVFTKNN